MKDDTTGYGGMDGSINLSSNVNGCGVCVVDNFIYILGGNSGSILKVDTNTKTMTTLNSSFNTINYGMYTSYCDNIIYSIGGYSTFGTKIYKLDTINDIISDTNITIPSTIFKGINDYASYLPTTNSIIYTLAVYSSSGTLNNQVYSYDIINNTITSKFTVSCTVPILGRGVIDNNTIYFINYENNAFKKYIYNLNPYNYSYNSYSIESDYNNWSEIRIFDGDYALGVGNTASNNYITARILYLPGAKMDRTFLSSNITYTTYIYYRGEQVYLNNKIYVVCGSKNVGYCNKIQIFNPVSYVPVINNHKDSILVYIDYSYTKTYINKKLGCIQKTGNSYKYEPIIFILYVSSDNNISPQLLDYYNIKNGEIV